MSRPDQSKDKNSPSLQPPAPGPNLLVSDVDNTLLGDDVALERFSDWYATAKDYLRLAYNSGRFPRSLAHSVRNTGLPEPDAFIGGVGTEITLSPSGERLRDWPPAADGWDAAAIRSVLMAHKELRPQPDHLQSEFKVSFYGDELDEIFVAHLHRQLADLGHMVEIVYSSNRDLDVLPAGVNKGTAIGFLADHWGIDPQRVLVAGDSGNDLDMFRQGFRGIVVGNAHPELKELSEPHVFHASGHYAAGVLEGLQYWLTKSVAEWHS
jgi:sucrose-6F-phosphate phosphohydrolase